MSRITEKFQEGKLFIPFITAGDPNLAITEELILAMTEAGADIIELGIPFSDPVAEGPVITRASERALAAGTSVDSIFELVKRVRTRCQTPIIFMTYTNLVFHYGVEKFCKKGEEAGVDGLILPDLPLEEREEFLFPCDTYHIDLIPLIAPTSKERIHQISENMRGFVYCVSSLGVTGMRSEITTDLEEMIGLVKEKGEIPCAVGFGISTPEQAAKISQYADGIIVGSAIVVKIEEYKEACVKPVVEYVKQMKEAIIEKNYKKI